MHRKSSCLFILTGCLVLLYGCNREPAEPTKGRFTDSRDQRVYEWVLIGTQTWMAENLAWLPEVNPPTSGSDSIPHYYVSGYAGTSVQAAKALEQYSKYGVFYNWVAAINRSDSSNSVPSGVRGVCPDGWHLPSDPEWDILVNYLGGKYVAGHKLKSTKGWNSYEGVSGKGDNSSGFHALPAGSRHNSDGFYPIGYNALFWTSSSFGEHAAWYRLLSYSHNGVNRYYINKQYGFSIRCVKDD